MRYFFSLLLVTSSLCSQTQINNELSFYIQRDELKFDQYKELSEDAFNNPLIFVSLGAHCQTAYQLDNFELRYNAFPFDWVLSDSTEHVISLLNNDFRNFFDEKYVFQNPVCEWWLDNPFYKFEFRHEWPYADRPIMHDARMKEVIEKTRIKYARRIDRFKKLKNFTGKVFFIRTGSNLDPDYYWRDEKCKTISKHQALLLENALHDFFPNLNFDLIIINYSETHPDYTVNIWAKNIVELKVLNAGTFAYDSFKHVFDFVKTRMPLPLSNNL